MKGRDDPMLAGLRTFFSAWLAKDNRFVAWLLGQIGIVRADTDEVGGEHVHR